MALAWTFSALGGTRPPNLLIRSRALFVWAVGLSPLVQLSSVGVSVLSPGILPVPLRSVAGQ
jgi:hypothetical protein